MDQSAQDRFEGLLSRLLDGQLDESESEQFSELLRVDPHARALYHEHIALHALLRWKESAAFEPEPNAVSASPGVFAAPQPVELHPPGHVLVSPPTGKRWSAASFVRLTRTRVVAGVAAAAILLFALLSWPGGAVTSASAAVMALDRLIATVGDPIDRMYRIRVTDFGPGNVRFDDRSRVPGIDGGDLYLRGSNKFVLVRRFVNGTVAYVDGSNGVQGWSVPPRGPVHLSDNPRRFSRGLPGEREGIPFLDLKTGLENLRQGYHLTLSSTDQAVAGKPNLSRLDALKRSPQLKGPSEVHIWFDPTGVAQRIELLGLEVFKNSPRSVVLELVEQRDLGPEFFDHGSHHSADRPIDRQ